MIQITLNIFLVIIFSVFFVMDSNKGKVGYVIFDLAIIFGNIFFALIHIKELFSAVGVG